MKATPCKNPLSEIVNLTLCVAVLIIQGLTSSSVAQSPPPQTPPESVAATTPNSTQARDNAALSMIDVKVRGIPNPIFSSPANYVARIPSLANAQIEVWLDTAGGSTVPGVSSQWKILPQPVLAIEDFRESLTRLEASQPTSTPTPAAGSIQKEPNRFALPIQIHLHGPQVFSETAAFLSASSGTVTKAEQIGCVVPSFLEVVATIGQTPQRIYQLPNLQEYSRTAAGAITFNQPSTVLATVTGKVRGTIDELRAFAESPDFSANVLFGAYTAQMDQTVFAANQTFYTSVANNVFGTDRQRNVLKWSKSSSGGSFMVNLPFVSESDQSAGESGSVTVDQHRLVSRDFLYDAVSRYQVVDGVESWGTLTSDQQLLVSKVTDLFLANAQTVSAKLIEGDANTMKVVIDELHFTRPVQVQQDDIELKSDSNPEATNTGKSEFDYFEVMKGKEERSFNAKYPSEVMLKRKQGVRFIPTSVKLVLLSQSKMEGQIRSFVREWKNPEQGSFTRNLPGIAGAELEFLGGSDPSATRLVSLATLDSRIRQFHSDHFPLIEKLQGPRIAFDGSGNTTSNGVVVTVNKDGSGTIKLNASGTGKAERAYPFAVQFLKYGEIMEEIPIPAVPARQTGSVGFMSTFSISRNTEIHLRPNTVESLFWPSQINFSPTASVTSQPSPTPRAR